VSTSHSPVDLAPTDSHDHGHQDEHDNHGHDNHRHNDDEHNHDGHEHGDHGHEHSGEGRAARLKQQVLHAVRPHSHDAADSVDHALEASADGIRAVKISLVALGVTAALQAAVVVLSGSVALLADTVHNLSDALTALPLWLAFALGRRPASRRYTYGLGRVEDLAGLSVVLMIALSAVFAAWESIRRLSDPQPMPYLGAVIVAGLVGFIGNEAVAVYRMRVGRRIGSAALVADGRHARADGITSLGVVAGALGVAAGWPLADPVVGLVITAAIVVVLVGAVRDVGRRLLDGVDPGLVDQAHAVLAGTPGVRAVQHVRMRWLGHRLHVEALAAVDPQLSLEQARGIADAAADGIRAAVEPLRGSVPDQVQVHAVPAAHAHA
jgi:cation diffusion facilitator family transporter